MITDIAPLLKNPGIDQGDWVDLRWNPLNETSVDIHIPVLVDRGVHVDWESPLEPTTGQYMKE